MAVYQPFAGYLTAYTTAVKNVMKDIYDPQIIPTVLRAGEVTRYFKPLPVAFPKGKSLIIRVETEPSQTARFFGTPFYESSNLGRLLPNPAMSPGWSYWQIHHLDLMGLAAGVRYAFPTEKIWDENDVTNVAQLLSRQSAEDIAEAQERGLITRKSGEVAQVVAISNSTAAYTAGSENHSLGNTSARLWLDRTGILFHQGAKIDIVTKGASYGSSVRFATVKGAGMENPASGVYGYIDVDASSTATARDGSSWRCVAASLTTASPGIFVYMSGEYAGTVIPDGPPVTASSYNHIYSVQDWFKSMNGVAGRAPGVIYNITRTTLGNQWALPNVVDKYSSGDVVITLEYLDSLLIQLFHGRLDQAEGLTNYVILAGPLTVDTLVKLTASANRRVDGAVQAGQSIVTNYNFDGIMIHHPTLQTPIAIQPVRGLPENMLFVIQPGVCEMLNLGPPAWFPWNSGGDEWANEQYTTGGQGGLRRSLMMRADRTYFCNSVIRMPKWCGALLGCKPA